MKTLCAAFCLTGTLVLSIVAAHTPERKILVKVALRGEPSAPDTVLITSSNLMPTNVAPGQQRVPAYRFSLARKTELCAKPVYLTGMSFWVETLDGAVLDPSAVIHNMRAEVEDGAPGGSLSVIGDAAEDGTWADLVARGDVVSERDTTISSSRPERLLEVDLLDPPLVPAADSLCVRISVDIQPDVIEPGFSMRFDRESIILNYDGCLPPHVLIHYDEGPGTTIYARTTVIPATLTGSFSNYPNPFAAGREVTTFTFYLPRQARVSLKLYTGFGRLLRTLDSGTLRGGGRVHEDIRWDGRDDGGARVQNGTYFAVLDVHYTDGSSDEAVRKVAVLR